MIKVGIIGVNGYAGGEVLRLLIHHPEVEVAAVASRSQTNRSVADIFPSLIGHKTGGMRIVAVDVQEFSGCDLVFLAVPHGVAAELAPALLEQGKKVIDLGADFRFRDVGVYEAWYGVKHSAAHYLAEAVYGLPELYRERIKGARLIGNPGCYPTSILLGTAPLLQRGLQEVELLIADSKSGVSGAGRSPKPDLHYAEVEGSLKAYGLVRHRHVAEIEEVASDLAGREVKVSFTPHLVPMVRGLFSTIHLTMKEEITTEELTRVYQDYYRGEPFVSILPEPGLPQTKAVIYTNNCHISLRVDPRTKQIIILSALDNLLKGAAGQAVQNMNLMCGLDETLGLNYTGIWP
ncbi:MAG TPA: N-acetyl-gamma-glutamyl-phosphate reductase [Firmicutes bacterium]|nr:N-acetyl-gamma-glutamyl-phosphate reductase [Bacillota bacterium]